MLPLRDKVALVTGAARGIGRGIATIMAQKGAHIIVNDISSQSKEIEKTVEEIRKTGRTCISVLADIGNKKEVENMVSQGLKEFGQIDVLVNNAGISRSKTLLKLTEEDWDDVLRVNVKGTFFCIQNVARHMMERNYGKIINISSVYGRIGAIGDINYAASKGAIMALTKSIAKELAKHRITVNAILPGPIDTPLLQGIKDEYLKAIIAEIPLKRIGTPEDIGNTVAFLASDEASFITGALIEVSGGWNM